MPGGSLQEKLSVQEIAKHLSRKELGSHLRCMEEIDSTNAYLKREAMTGAPAGTVAVAEYQTAGRGRRGRSFLSPAGKGVYFSVLLRPHLPPEKLMCATGLAAVAVCRAVEQCCGAKIEIKWVNDLVLNGKKLGGILTELVLDGSEQDPTLLIGVGINVSHSREDFTPEVAELATSLAMEGYTLSRAQLAAALIEQLHLLSELLGGDISSWVAEYRRRCVNLGKDVQLLWSDNRERATALDVDESLGLVIRRTDGTMDVVRTGEVSVRGLYGYVD